MGLLLLLLAAAPDAPREVRVALLPLQLPREVTAAGPSEVPKSLLDARRLADELRFEEAFVEYQRYLGDPNRPVAERAKALLELGFLHLLLEDQVNAQKRTVEALELDPEVRLPPGASSRHAAFVETVRKSLAARARLEVLPRAGADPPRTVHAHLTDPQGRAKRVLIRHALSPAGPFHSSPMRCHGERCQGSIPLPRGASSFTAWYYAEALDEDGDTIATAAGPQEPLQLSVVGQDAWYEDPWIWGASGVAVVAVAGVVYLFSPAPPR
ncbi:MAG: hypothetical protein HYZ28_11850 [Myxococcales bacterium]|nr:hypothetical protein [Myxococcales bacterium]